MYVSREVWRYEGNKDENKSSFSDQGRCDGGNPSSLCKSYPMLCINVWMVDLRMIDVSVTVIMIHRADNYR